MLKNVYGVLIYPQFYDQIYRRLKMLPHPFINSYVGTKGGELLKEQWLIDLDHGAEKIIWLSTDKTRAVKYWQQQENIF